MCSRPITFIATLALSLFWLTGCSESDTKFVPDSETALAAVTAAMNAWKNGVAPGPVPHTAPLVHLTDSHRQPGQALSEFEVLGEVPGNADRCFAVRLKLSSPEAEERVRYVVVGIDPLWVFRHEDYDMLMHWEHPMEKTADADDPAADSPSGDAKSGN